jgi:predicted nucleic acid-binding protein
VNQRHPPIVVDTNILFSALLREPSRFVELLFQAEYDFYIGEYVIVELFKHKDRLVQQSKLDEDDLLRLLYRLLKQLNIYPERLISPGRVAEAQHLCALIDVDDTVHVALTLALDGWLWTGDRSLMDGLRQQGFDRFFVPSAPGRRFTYPPQS